MKRLIMSFLALSACAVAYADEPWLADFRRADLNDSGGLSQVELQKSSAPSLQTLRDHFMAIDADGDGHVTLDEYRRYEAGRQQVSAPSPVGTCLNDCGVVVEVDRYKVDGQGGLLGAVAGGVVGGLLGNQVGKGTGKTVATVGGAAGGAYAGYEVEKRMKSRKMTRVTVQFDNGQRRDFEYEVDAPPFRKGMRVQLRDGQLTAYTGQ